MELQASIAEGLQSMARLFQDRSREEQMALLAALERAGAAIYRSLAEGEKSEPARAALLTAASREEQNAEVLESLTAG